MSEPTQVRSDVPSPHTLRNRLGRALWAGGSVLFRMVPTPLHGVRRAILRAFGAKLAPRCYVYPSVRIWAPWNLEMGQHSSLGDRVICYNVAPIRVGAFATVSQYAHLCTASHDHADPAMPLTTAPIDIEEGAWVCADAFVSMGVRIGRNAVIGARAVVTKSMPANTVCVGFPCKPLKPRFAEGGAQ